MANKNDLLLGISINKLIKFHKEWKKFELDGVLPMESQLRIMAKKHFGSDTAMNLIAVHYEIVRKLADYYITSHTIMHELEMD